MKDINGKELEIGDVIAYSCNGYLEVAQIIDIPFNQNWGMKLKLSCEYECKTYKWGVNVNKSYLKKCKSKMSNLINHNSWIIKIITDCVVVDNNKLDTSTLTSRYKLSKKVF